MFKKTENVKEPKQKKVKAAPVAPEVKESRVMAILKKEYAFENWLLAILSPILVLYGVYIDLGKFGSVNLTTILGNSGIGFIDFFFQTDWSRIVVGSVLILIGLLVIVYLLIPIIKPSIDEMKKVSWPTVRQLGRDSGRVFIFLGFLMLLFTLYGYALDPLFNWLYSFAS